jgi:hypothetical protein
MLAVLLQAVGKVLYSTWLPDMPAPAPARLRKN